MRVFLCHSSKDKNIVAEVASRLGRAFVVYDDFSFDTAAEFKNEIDKGLSNSELFVLFASNNSLGAHWVQIELSEAQKLQIRGQIRKIVVIIIDDATKFNELPDWLQQAKAIRLTSASQIEREIRLQLHSVLQEYQTGLFVGRRKEIDIAERLIAPTDTLAEPHAFCFYGLAGIGRKTLCSRVASSLLNLPKIAVIRIEDGDLLTELTLKLNEDLSPSKSTKDIEARLASLEAMPFEEKLRKYLDLTIQYADARELLVLQDEGGLLDNDGMVHDEFMKVVMATQAEHRLRVGLVTRRKPLFESPEQEFPCIRVPPLETDDIKRLLLRRLRDFRVNISDDEASELASYIGGYAPAATYVAELAHRDGIGRILEDKSLLVDFTASFMIRMLSKYHPLTTHQQQILTVLSFYSPLPMSVIGHCVDLDSAALNDQIQYLLDVAFVVPDDRLFRIADPLINAVIRTFGRSWHSHEKVAKALERYLEHLADDDIRFVLARSLFRALKYSGRSEETSKQSVALTSDFIDLSQHFYHERDYDKAIEFCRAALDRRPSNVDVRAYLVRSLVQKEMFEEAEKEISKIVSQGFLRDAWFLRGFLHRHKQEYSEAIRAYERSIGYGRKGAAVHRELAQCYYEIGNLDKAKSHIAESQRNDPDNRYVVDLEIQIAMRLGDRPTAEKRLAVLRLVDDDRFFLHRRSTVRSVFGEREPAYADALASYRQFERPPFAVASQLVKTEIELGRFDDASEHLELIDRSYSGRHDIKLGLRCKYETARGHFDEALGLWNRLRDKNKAVHLALRFHALQGLRRINPSPEVDRMISELTLKLVGVDLEKLEREFGLVVQRE